MDTKEWPEGLRTGDDYRSSKRDGREVWYRGQQIEDVTTHPATAGLIDLIAGIYDQHHDPAARDELTYVRDDGRRMSAMWLAPRTEEELDLRRRCCEHIAWETFGVVGRAPDLISWTQVGLLGQLPAFRRLSPEYADNMLAYQEHAEEHLPHLAAVIAEPQGIRSRSGAAGEDRTGVFRVTRKSEEGIWLSGARTAGSIAAQADEILVSTIFTDRPEESTWATIPIATPGLRLICREATAAPAASRADHPIAMRGDELDCLVVLDEVFVPRERVWCYGAPELQSQMFYSDVSPGEHWNVMTRLCVKLEIFSGLAQLVAEALDVTGQPMVRDTVGRIAQVAQVVRSGVIAAQELAAPTEGGILMPDKNVISAVRAYAIDQYPHVVHMLQELCGQGLVVRFPDESFDHPDLAPRLSLYLDQPSISARQKNRLMNLVWDLTTDSHAGRAALFENVNATPSFILRQKLYHQYDRSGFAERIKRSTGLTEDPEPTAAPTTSSAREGWTT
jgi:4-hydroxyphenylacetate 3-monooxygenase